MAGHGIGRPAFLIPERLRKKPRALIQALAQSINGRVISRYEPCGTLFLYGWGGVEQQNAIRMHRGNYVAFDLGYWEREGFNDQKWRVAINGFHSPQLILRGAHPGPHRLAESGITLRSLRPGPSSVLLVGNGPKSQRVGARHWTFGKAKLLRRRLPGWRILYKPKPERPAEPRIDFDELVDGPIEHILPRVGLVVCRHSNVAVDACRLGVPVVCDDGAAACIYPQSIDDRGRQPTLDVRREFLERLAWWQWSIDDINRGEFWPWLRKKLTEI